MRPTGLLSRLRLAPLAVAALALAPLALAACGDCDCEQHRATAGSTAATAGAAAPQAAAPAAPATAASQAAGAAGEAEPTPPVVATRWRGEGSTLEFSAWRMRCAGCEKKVEDTLKALPGVKDALASHADSKVVVTLAEPALRDSLPAQIAAALEAQGFRVLGQ